MKPAIEILKEIRRLAVVEGQKDDSGQGYSSGQASGLRVSGDLVEAWLREADEEIARSLIANTVYWIRHKIFGTTQKPKQEGEK